MHMTPAMLEASYELLRTTPPFRGWRLPPGDEVEFHTINSGKFAADYRPLGGGHIIRINTQWHASIHSLTKTMAHEMTHMHHALRHPKDTAHHGKRFWAFAKTVCRHHGWSVKEF